MPKPNISLEVPNNGTGEFVDPASFTGTTDSDGTLRDSNGTEFDPAIHAGGHNRDGSWRRKRRRRNGSGKAYAQNRRDIKEAAEILTKGLMVSHMALAAMTKCEELILDETEAQALSESGLTLLSLYDIRPDPKVEALITFAGVLGMTYGTRIVAIRARIAQQKEEKSAGKAGVYGSDGTPMGTTEWQPGAPEWPINGATAN